MPKKPGDILPPLKSRTKKQEELLRHLQHRILTFALGPAGTGKTYIGTRYACDLFEKKDIDRIIITRPMVMAEDDFGFLPGTLEEKYAPYFSPVREIMEKSIGKGQTDYMLKSGQAQLAPVAFLRGHTFDNCFMILDEAQNMTPKQMQLFLTRIGENTKVVLCGDMSQSDIEGPSGLQDAHDRLHDLAEVGTVIFEEADIVRSGFVQKVVSRYK